MLPQFFHESMQGAPAGNISSQGNVITILDACLVNGFNSQTGLGLSRAAQLVTVNKTGHGYVDRQLVTIAGATQTDYNGVFRIRRIDANTFTYTLASGLTPTTPATGTITGLTTPLGWSKVYSATNKAVYRAPVGTRHYIRFDATNTAADQTLWCESFRAMTSVTAGTNQYPNLVRGGSNSIAGDRARHIKSITRVAGDMGWALVGDDRRFVWMPSLSLYSRSPLHFGEFKSYVAADAYNSFSAGTQFAGGANVDNVGNFNVSTFFPLLQATNNPDDSSTSYIPSQNAALAANPSGTQLSVNPGFSSFNAGTGTAGAGSFGLNYGDPFTTNDVILGHPLILEQPLASSSVIGLRGKLQHLLCCGHMVDAFTPGGQEKMFVSENVPVYGQVLNVTVRHGNTNDVNQLAVYTFPLQDWETL